MRCEALATSHWLIDWLEHMSRDTGTRSWIPIPQGSTGPAGYNGIPRELLAYHPQVLLHFQHSQVGVPTCKASLTVGQMSGQLSTETQTVFIYLQIFVLYIPTLPTSPLLWALANISTTSRGHLTACPRHVLSNVLSGLYSTKPHLARLR